MAALRGTESTEPSPVRNRHQLPRPLRGGDGGRGKKRARGREGEQAWLAISDEGIGIPEDDLPGLFDEFYRSKHADKHGIGGMGLGLYLVQQIVKAHGGRIEVTSELNTGSAFTVFLPLLGADPDR